jgi:hypothetical protein
LVTPGDCLSTVRSSGALTTALAEGIPDAEGSIDRVRATIEMRKRFMTYDPIATDQVFA